MNTNTIFWGLICCALLASCNRIPSTVKQQNYNLKIHGIVFRLVDYKQRIEYLQKNNQSAFAEQVAKKAEVQNRLTMQYFKEHFNYCPVYFVFSSQTKDLLEGKRVLLNENLQPDERITPPEKLYLMYYGIDDNLDRSTNIDGFRMDKTGLFIRPAFKTWLTNSDLQHHDIIKLNRVMSNL